jgi:hypothetical protein
LLRFRYELSAEMLVLTCIPMMFSSVMLGYSNRPIRGPTPSAIGRFRLRVSSRAEILLIVF